MSTSPTPPKTLTYVAGSTDPEQQLDLYLPASTPASSLIIFIHGGAWRTGSRIDHADLATYLCDKGKAVAVVDYRLSVKDEKTGLPKHIHPVHAQDVNAALALLRGREDVPKKDWIVVGHSIGAWLALAAIVSGVPRGGNAEYPAAMPVPESKAREAIKTCVLVVSISFLLVTCVQYCADPHSRSFLLTAGWHLLSIKLAQRVPGLRRLRSASIPPTTRTYQLRCCIYRDMAAGFRG